jgi:hypothetical protein
MEEGKPRRYLTVLSKKTTIQNRSKRPKFDFKSLPPTPPLPNSKGKRYQSGTI